MARFVKEVMNRELFSVGPEDSAASALDGLLGLGITAAPVLDDQRRLLGVVALRDVAKVHGVGRVRERMSSPAAVVRDDALIGEAARLLGETGYRHLVVVDADGHAVGMLSALDALRGVLGMPAPHPAAFPHLDLRAGAYFTDEVPLDQKHVDAAPDGPGVLALIHGVPGVADRVVWVESSNNVRSRLVDMLSTPQDDRPGLARWLERDDVRYRAASLADPEARQAVVDRLRSAESPLFPSSR
jgi:CBS domain-containing protein